MKNSILVLLLALLPFIGMAEGYEIGDKASDFSLKNIDGKMMSLADLSDNKGAIVIFTCNHCPYAKLYEDRIIALDKKYKGIGYPVVALNPNDPKIEPADGYQEMIQRSKEKGFTFPYLVDKDSKMAKTYGATRTPHVYLLQKEGTDYVVKYIGAIDNNAKNATQADKLYLADALEALIAGKAITKTSSKAIGCTIKWHETK
ncbi:thioredoxin family protein [Persicobacter diffluens]|uniref:Thioredoxin family protein n=1 Tax=Persicobacter diffluens TaxID=981 RepID=A0AAN4VVF5_9BACT|nr:thioredoxin family protein [Persicobacter diffluens]